MTAIISNAPHRVAILGAIETKKSGGQNTESENFPTANEASKKAGFGNERTARQAKIVTEKAAPELVEAMDTGKISIASAEKLNHLTKSQLALAAAKCLEYHTDAAKRRQLANLRQNKLTVPADLPERQNEESREIVATEFGVGTTAIKKANVVRLYGGQESVKAVESLLILFR